MEKTISCCLIVAFLILVKGYETTLTDNRLKVYEAYKNVYYDPLTNSTLKTEIEDSGRFPYTRIGFRSLPCTCNNLACGCCAGINITRIKFDQKICTNFTYDSYEFAITMDVEMNNRNVFNRQISAKNPPPICVPLPYLPAVDFCVRFYNVHMPGNNLQACIDFETRVIQSPILVLHFDCIRIGLDGIVWVKPDENGGLERPDTDDDSSPTNSEPEIYDEVDFEPGGLQAVVASNYTNNNSSGTLNDDDNIGQLKY